MKEQFVIIGDNVALILSESEPAGVDIVDKVMR